VIELPSLRLIGKKLAKNLGRFDPNLQIKQDGLDLFEGEMLIAAVEGSSSEVELIWDEAREFWVSTIVQAITAS